MSALIQFAIFPTDKGESVGKEVSEVIKMIDQSGISYKLTPMGTIIETETLIEGLGIINRAYEILEPVSQRVYATVSIDVRKNTSNRMNSKIKSIENRIGPVKK